MVFLWGILSVVFDFRKGFGEINHMTVMNVVGFVTRKYRTGTVFALWSLWGVEAKRITFLIRENTSVLIVDSMQIRPA